MTVLIAVTECYGENHQHRRTTWVNPASVSRFTEDRLWRADQQQPRPRVTRIRFIDGDSIVAEEAPEAIAACIDGGFDPDVLLTVAQQADLAEREPAS